MKKGILLLSISFGIVLAVECKNYTVKEGDTLERIAKREGIDLQVLRSANKSLKGDTLKVGQSICIPVRAKSVEKYALYEVKRGDTLEKIAESFGVDVKTLKDFNDLKGDKLVEGQRIKIPAKNASKNKEPYDFYTLKTGGRLKDVSKVTGVPLRELERLNPDLKDKFIKAGTKVKVPAGNSIDRGGAETAKAGGEDYELYVVKRGGKLEHVAKATGTPLKELERLNPKLKDRWLSPGTQVKVPKEPSTPKTKKEEKEVRYELYTVKRGARLEHVAKATGTETAELERLNPDLKGKWLPAGTQVRIPAKGISEEKKKFKAEEPYDFYTLKTGGRLKDVSKVTGVPLRELERLNPDLKDKFIKAGTKVKVPKAPSTTKVQETAPSRREERLVVVEPEKDAGAATSPSAIKGIRISLPVEGKVTKVPKGIEIYAPCSTPVKSVEDGRVIYSGGDLQAYGNMVIVEHDSFISLYAHNETNLVKRGEKVSKGQVIARLGKKSNTEECALRFELRSKEGVPLDPTEYIKDIQ
ncbi:MAG: LysM peptidoglycan-binding domain-containing protein [Aquificaceae bacterium]|nr:LysM peptidoglycan-binding domain-containing protein [Aquificaceae bacterium]